MTVTLAASLIAMLALANGAPIIARRILGPRLSTPMDMGFTLADGSRLLGESKTWRGVAAAVVACTLMAPMLGLPPQSGAVLAATAMAGDATTSFIKRRLGLAAGRAVPVLDQLLEAAVPLLTLHEPLALGPKDVVLLVAAFCALDLLISPVLHHFGIRRRPR
jgi:CDP-2,3-bis-(O-geranylgeranyl)-sn-glycerol synthase